MECFQRVFVGNGRSLVWPNARCARYLSQEINIEKHKPKTGILLLNMGGPQTVNDVPDYLLRIMTDRNLIQLPMQRFLGPYIAKKRTAEVQKKYEEIGGGSPILKWTQKQGNGLVERLDTASPSTAPHKYYVAFRYANPLTDETMRQIEKDQLDHLVVFSQYPQFSCATSGSSFDAIYHYFRKRQVPANMKWTVIDRWPTHSLLCQCIADRIKTELNFFPVEEQKDVVLLFSAHSLPLKAVKRGDSYPYEVGATVQAVMETMKYSNPYAITWQSKVGPVPWLEPATEDAIKGFHKRGLKNFILVPIAFTNEHIETLHELDIEYGKDLVKELGGKITIRRAAAPNDHKLFLDCLADIVETAVKADERVTNKFLSRCPKCTNRSCQPYKRFFAKVCQK
ncbi:hypothetical protein R5R35_009382 [Gryllus longicercus]|uniref:Ferrochelatase n=2 Tax=Gryllus longicercus TaxID=2509291 RepID=A0AAN9VRH7_9ORTH